MNNNTKFTTRSLTAAAITVALICVCAMITIPLPIPITMQSFGVFFALFFLGGRLGTISVFVYLAIGAVGVPVFAGFTGGVAHLFDAGGGFLFGMLLSALLFWLLECIFPKSTVFSLLASFIALIFLYTVGALWYAFVYLDNASFSSVILGAVLPFIIPDTVKIALAYFLSSRLRAVIKL